MGRDNKLSFWQCTAVMGGSYSVYTTALGVAMSIYSGSWLCLMLAPIGLLIAFSYSLAWYIYRPWMAIKFPSKHMFIDGATSLGELMLGSLLFSTLPIAKLLIGG
jgi:hypothetical protein